MKKIWLKRMAAWLLAAVMTVMPVLAEGELREEPMFSAESADSTVEVSDWLDLGDDGDVSAASVATVESVPLVDDGSFEEETFEDEITEEEITEEEITGWESAEEGAVIEEAVDDGAETGAGSGEDRAALDVPAEAGEISGTEASEDGERADETGAADTREPSEAGEGADDPDQFEGAEGTEDTENTEDAEPIEDIENTEDSEDTENSEDSEDPEDSEAEAMAAEAGENAGEDEESGEGEESEEEKPEDGEESEEEKSEDGEAADGEENPDAVEAAGAQASAKAMAAATAEPKMADVIMGKGEKRLLASPFAGSTAADITWSSSKPRVVSVSAAGRLKAKRRGSAVITLVNKDGKRLTCNVYVYKAPSKVSIKPGKKLSIGLGEVYQLTGKLPKGTGSGLSWSSRNPAVATVDAQGRVTGRATGSAKIVVKTFNGKKATCKITVAAAPTGVVFSNPVRTLAVGMSVDLKPVTNPGSAGTVTLSRDQPGVLALSGTTIIGAAAGTATVTGKTYNGKTCTLTVKVVPAPTAMGLGMTSLTMGVGEKFTLTPSVNAGSAASYTFKSSKKKVAKVSAAGVIKAKKRGSATITVTTHNGLKAKLKLKVAKAPSKVTLKPRAVALEPGNSYQLKVSLPKGSASRITFKSSDPGVVTVDGSGLLVGVKAGSATVTATTFNKKKATCRVTVGAAGSIGSLKLSSKGMVMLRKGATWKLTATASTSLSSIKWSTTSASIAKIKASGDTCTVTGASPGTAIVSAKLSNGEYASVIVMTVDVSDLSASNFNNVQKALLAHEDLVTGAQGGNVIWDMISARLLKANYPQNRVNTMIASLKAADATYRNIYIYSFGTYSFQGNAGVSASYYDSDSNTLYISGSNSYSDTNFAYVAFHESGHAIDYNADGNGKLNSLNNAATTAVLGDVRSVLTSHLNTAIVYAGVSAANVNGSKVVDALMDYRTLLQKENVMSELGLNADEQKVYTALSNLVASEMNSTLPTNNGCMVWDAVEGATNYAVSGNFGHAYLLSIDEYAEAASYYFYDRKGNPSITTEPWAEFFSANIMQDSNTLSLNWSYLPQTCKYFAETFAPAVLSYFTSYIKNL